MRLDDAGPRTWLMATVAGWAVLAWLLALLGWGAMPRPLDADPGLLASAAAGACDRALRLGRCRSMRAIARRPLFSQDRQPKPFFLQGQGEGEGRQTRSTTCLPAC